MQFYKKETIDSNYQLLEISAFVSLCLFYLLVQNSNAILQKETMDPNSQPLAISAFVIESSYHIANHF